MNIRKTLLSGIIATSMTVGGAAAFAQDSTPESGTSETVASPVADIATIEGIPVLDAEGVEVGTLSVWEDEDGEGVWISMNNEDAAAMIEGKKGVHIHETGVCDPEGDFESAGAHFDPTMEDHGDLNSDPSHGGDLGNLEVDEDGNFEHEVLAEKITMVAGEENSLADEDGSAIVIHAGEDDLESQPSGESGDRIACAVIFPPVDPVGTPAASPESPDMATPEN